jgi:membrane dipeptidase
MADQATGNPDAGAQAKALTRDGFVFDALSLTYVLDEPYAERCLAAGVNGTNLSFGLAENWDEASRIFEDGLEKIEKNPVLTLATTFGDFATAQSEGRLAIVPGTQGADLIGDDLRRVEALDRLGLRFIGLAYTAGNLLADGCGETRGGGLTFLGQDFIAAVNERPMLLDLSHSAHQARLEAAGLATRPVCTHSNAYASEQNDRNTKDECLDLIAAKDGVVGICALPKTVRSKHPTIVDMLDHGEYLAERLGPAQVGIGLDLVEAHKENKTILPASVRWRTLRPDIFGTVEEFHSQSYPTGLESISKIANLTQGLLDRGYGETDITGILGGNWLRLLGRVM